jgi:hypothetical protein
VRDGVPLPGDDDSAGEEPAPLWWWDDIDDEAMRAACSSKSSARFLRTRLGTNLPSFFYLMKLNLNWNLPKTDKFEL